MTTLLVFTTGCSISTPFQFADAPSATANETETVVVGLTHAVYKRDWKSRRTFWRHVASVEASLSGQSGFVGSSIRRQLFGNSAWTMTVWTDEASLNAFVNSPVHQSAIRSAWHTLEDANFSRLEIPRDQIPLDWSKAIDLVAATGRQYGN